MLNRVLLFATRPILWHYSGSKSRSKEISVTEQNETDNTSENPFPAMIVFSLMFAGVVCAVGLIIMALDNYFTLEGFIRLGVFMLGVGIIGAFVGFLGWCDSGPPQFKKGGGRTT